MTDEQKKILAQLRAHFRDVPYPGDKNIVRHSCWECDPIRDTFKGKSWEPFLNNPYDLLGYFHREPRLKIRRDCLSLLTGEAFHYFLPLFLAAAVLDPAEADVMTISLTHGFDPGPQPEPAEDSLKSWQHNHDKCKNLLEAMTPEQRRTAAAVFRVLIAVEGDCSIRPNYADAIENLETGKVVGWRLPRPE